MAPKQPTTPNHADGVHQGVQATSTLNRMVTRPQTAAPVQPVEAAVPAPVTPASKTAALTLPPSVTSRTEVSRTLREIQGLDEYFRQAGIRGSKDQPLPAISRVLETFSAENGLNMLHAEDRAVAGEFFEDVKAHAPVVHVSFAAEPSGEFMMKFLGWFRSEAHPYTVMHIGLQPELAAGCTIRTTNKVFDFSFRAKFDENKAKLTAAIEELGKDITGDLAAAPAAEAAVEPPTSPANPELQESGL